MLGMLAVVNLGLAGLAFYMLVWPVLVYLADPKGLRRFPAPSLWGIPSFAGWSNAWLAIVIAKYKRSDYVQAAHERYGPVVRIQPNHLSFIDPAAVKDIYSFQAKMLKGEAYESFSDPVWGHNWKSIVNTADREEHARKRRYISNAFAQRTVVTLDPLVMQGIEKLNKQLDLIASRYPVEKEKPNANLFRDGCTNLYRWINLFAFDLVGEISFGKPLGLLEQGDDVMEALPFDGTSPIYKTNIIDSFQGGNMYDCFFGPWPAACHQLKALTQWHWNAKKNKAFGEFVNIQARDRLRRPNPESFRDFMSYFLENNKGEKISLEYGEIWREASILLAGGSDTSTSSMTNTIYLLLTNPRCLKKLREEIDPVLKGASAASYHQVCELPYLRAVVEEALRDRPPVGQGLPRTVPEGGATVAGRFLKGGTQVSVPVYSLHHNAAIFPDPHAFIPERWLPHDNMTRAEKEQLDKLKNFCIPFSTGPRACIGRNIVYLESLMLVATLVHRYDFELPSEDWRMDTRERLNINPAALWVRVKKREGLVG